MAQPKPDCIGTSERKTGEIARWEAKPNGIPDATEGVKPHFTPRKQGLPSSNGGAPAASSLPTQSRISGSLLQNFNGLSNVDSANFNFGIVVEPPDQGLCVGNLAGQPEVFEMVNIVLAAYTPDGSTILFEDGVNDFFAEPQSPNRNLRVALLRSILLTSLTFLSLVFP